MRLPQDAERFLQDFLPFEERRIRRDGVHLFGIRYWADVLSAWAGRFSGHVRVRYDPRDLSCVFVEGPDGSNWCNPPDRLIGDPGGTYGDDVVDTNLWIKPPGESDGECNGGPIAGAFWPNAAVDLTRDVR